MSSRSPPTSPPTPTSEPQCESVQLRVQYKSKKSKERAFSDADLARLEDDSPGIAQCLDERIRSVTNVVGRGPEVERARDLLAGKWPGRWGGAVDLMVAGTFGAQAGVGRVSKNSFTVYLDKNCDATLTPSSPVCESITMRYRHSPISLLWDADVSIDDVGTVVQFPLVPESKGWFIWKGSSRTPLLVLDRLASGQVKDGTRLLGNYTNGGKPSAGISPVSSLGKSERSSQRFTPWEDGFEALGMYDLNRDGEISDAELDFFSLWFDHNQNGISEPGELVSLREAGVTSLRYQGAKRDAMGNVTLPAGYTRILSDGTEVSYALVDWYSDEYESSEAAMQGLFSRSIMTSSSKNLRVVDESKEINESISSDGGIGLAPVGEPVSASEESETARLPSGELAGLWKWWYLDTPERAAGNDSGIFIFDHDGDTITGRSMIELEVESDNSSISAMLVSAALEGTTEGIGEAMELRFEVAPDAAAGISLTTKSSAVLKDGKLIGLSEMRDQAGNVTTFRWEAEHVMKEPKIEN